MCIFSVLLANQAHHSSNTKNSQLTLYFSPEIWSKDFFQWMDTYLSKVNFYRLSLGFSQYEYN